MNKAQREYAEYLKSATKQLVDKIKTDNEADINILEMVYGFARRGFLESRKAAE